MNTEIITIGDEILIGHIQDKNAHWMAENLTVNGFSIRRITSIPDDLEAIISQLTRASKQADIVFVTGGLGPTNDDITRIAIEKFFDTKWVKNKAVYERLKAYLSERGYSLSFHNENQAKVPEKAEIFMNMVGTAPGFMLTKNKTTFVFMPGVHFEMKQMMTDAIIPGLKEKYIKDELINQVVITQGVPEAHLAHYLKDWEAGLPEHIRLAYLPGPGIVKLRLSGKADENNNTRETIRQKIEELRQIIPEYFVVAENKRLEEVLGELMVEKKLTISTAESCTGGGIAAALTSVSGSSSYFKGSAVAYSNEIKQKILQVDNQLLIQHGAVSKQVTEVMAKNVKQLYQTDCSIAVSGIAGPTGGTKDKPVGTTWITVAFGDHVNSQHFLFGKRRDVNIQKTIQAALNMLRKLIIEKN